MAGLAAAWRLSAADVRDEVEVTVYQRGWRLGGKCATSRGVHGRIEEHGLHVWLGYYDNAFRLLQDVYGELDRPATDPGCPVATWRDAVAPADDVGVEDGGSGSWAHWLARFSPNDEVPGSAPEGAPPLSGATFVRRGLRLLGDFAASLEPAPATPAVLLSASPRRPRTTTGGVGSLVRQAETVLAVGADAGLRLLADVGPRMAPALAPLIGDLLGDVRAAISTGLRADPARRRTAQLADIVLTCLLGVLRDGLLDARTGFAAIDHLDFREWLARHGASPAALESPLIRGLYDLVFAYEHGDARRPRFAAGLGLFLAGKLFFDYRGSIFWHLQGGMGDVVVAPLYQVLRARGVTFAFFHRLDALHLDPGGTRIAAVTLGRQARTRHAADYAPLTRVGRLPCFPGAPPADQLDGPAPRDLESHWGDRTGEEPVRLAVGTDVDDIVLATSVGMLAHVSGELMAASARWRAMVTGLATVPTQALQLWLRADERELGWTRPGTTVSGYVTPFDTYAAMSHVLAREDWPASDPPRAAAWFCSVLPTEVADDPARAHAVVRANAVAYLDRHAGHFWPGAVSTDGGFRWPLLVGAPPDAAAEAIDTQYWTANVDPSDRYVQSLPGSGSRRLPATGSGFAHLFLAGDWIDSGLNAGCVEAAVMAGYQAANGVLGRAANAGIRGSWAAVGAP